MFKTLWSRFPLKVDEIKQRSKETIKRNQTVPLEKERVKKTNTFRDYDKFPLKFREVIPYEDLYELYFNQNLLVEEVAALLNVPIYTVKRCLRKYKIIKSEKQLRELHNRISSEWFSYTCNKLKGVHEVINPILKDKHLERQKQAQELGFKTKKRNKSLSLSKPEQFILSILKTRFTDIEMQQTYEKYPFHVDFYIPELNLYIEYQGHISHGKHPFNIKSNTDLLCINQWIQRYLNKPSKKNPYLAYIKTWLIKDRIKRNTAKQNKLNWKEFFSMQEFILWFNTVKSYENIEQYDKLIEIMSEWLFRLD